VQIVDQLDAQSDSHGTDGYFPARYEQPIDAPGIGLPSTHFVLTARVLYVSVDMPPVQKPRVATCAVGIGLKFRAEGRFAFITDSIG
jgi:hypothetical protein